MHLKSLTKRIEDYYGFKTPLVWSNITLFVILHSLSLYAITLFPSTKPLSLLFGAFCVLIADTCISSGAHRLWTHRTYKAKLPMRIFLMLGYMLGAQYSLVQWARDHRTHHKFTDTDADPHSSNRGLFFSHCGWLMMKRHPELIEKGKVIDVSDMWQDPVVRFHEKYFIWLTLILHVIFPVAFTYYVIGDTLKNAILVNLIFRTALSLNLVWCTNSLAHYWGDKPYNKNILASQNAFLAFILVGEGWHNFHHTFPWDYRIGERGQHFQFAANVIEFFSLFGQAYDLKAVDPKIIERVKEKNKTIPKNFEVPETGLSETDDITDKASLMQRKQTVAA